MKKLSRIAGAAVAIALLLGGCGTPMYELTPEEETIIVRYAAYALAKHNVYQKDGMLDVEESLLEESQKPEEPAGETQKPDTPSGSSPGEISQNAPSGEAVTITEALGQGENLSISYGGYMITDHYQEGEYFSMYADEGRTYVILKFTMENISSKAVTVDIMEKMPTFRACFDGKSWVREEKTFLLGSLSHYKGELAAGQREELVLVFHISEKKAQNITGVSLSVEVDGDEKPIKL